MQCANGQAAAVVGLDNTCGSTVGAIYVPSGGSTCSACAVGTCPGTPCAQQTCAIGPQPLDAPWPMIGHDPEHRSLSPNAGPASTPAVLWAATGGAFDGVTIANDGAVFSSISALGTVTAYDGETGAIRWLKIVPVNGSTTYTIGPAFTVLGFSQASVLTAFLQSNGIVQSNAYFPFSTYVGDAVLSADGSIMAYSTSTIIYFRTAQTQGQVYTTATNNSIPTSFSGHTVYSTTTGLALFSVAPASGQWTSALTTSYGNPATPSISVGSDMVFVATDQGYVLGLSATTGTVSWATKPCPQACAARTRALMAVSADGYSLYVPVSRVGASGYAGVVAVSASTGATKWTLATNDDARALALDSAGTLFVGDASGAVFGVRAATGAVAWTTTVRAAVVSFALGANGALYVATNASLVALR